MQYHKPHVFSFKSHVEYGILAARSLCDDHRNVSGFRRKLCPLPCWSAQKRNENFLLEERITFLIRTYNYICQTRSFLSFPTSIHSNFTNWSPRIMGSSLFHTLSRPQILAVIYSVSSIKSHNDALKSNHSSAHNSLMVSCLTQNKSQKAANGPPGLASTFPSPSATTPGGCSLPCSCTALFLPPFFFLNHKEPYFSRKEGERRKQVSGWGGTYTERLPSGLYNVHSSSRLIFIIMLWIVNQLRFHLKNNTMRYILLPLFYRWGSESLNNFAKVTHLLQFRAGFQAQPSWYSFKARALFLLPGN